MIHEKSNQQILKELDELVYGHQDAKKALINLVNRSKMRYHQLYHSSPPLKKEDVISNINCFLIGDSGTGKTHLVQSLAKICEFPLLCIDANQLAPTNAMEGFSVDRLIKQVRRTARELVESKPDRYYSLEGAMKQTVIFVDEMDKLAKSFESSGNWNKHVQSNFLAMFENNTELDSISFIFAGAFASMEKYAKSDTKNRLGFMAAKEQVDTEFDIEQSIIKYGLIPELVGRVHNIIVLDKLKKEDFENILNKLVMPSIRKELKNFGINNFRLTEKEYTAIIEKALKSKMGVRSLKKEVLKITQELEFDYEWTSRSTKVKALASPKDKELEERIEKIEELLFEDEEEKDS